MKGDARLLACALVSLWGPCLRAQDAIFAEPGSRVRLTTAPSASPNGPPTTPRSEPGQTVVGALIVADDETLTLRLDRTRRPLRVPRLSIRTLEVSTGRQSGRNKGAMVGAALGSVLIYVTTRCPESDPRCPLDSHVGDRLAGAAVGALAYGLVGAGIGSIFKTDRWVPVSREAIRVSLAPARERGVRLALSVRF